MNKLLIISIYDSGYYFSVYDNGKIYNREEIEYDKEHKFYTLFHTYRDIHNIIEETFINDYDKIFICEDGDVEKVK